MQSANEEHVKEGPGDSRQNHARKPSLSSSQLEMKENHQRDRNEKSQQPDGDKVSGSPANNGSRAPGNDWARKLGFDRGRRRGFFTLSQEIHNELGRGEQ